MEGVSLINPDGNILFVRSSHGRSVATTQLLTIWSSVLFSQSEAELDPVSCITDSLRIYILKRNTHTVICWFDKAVNEYYARRLTDYADKIILLLLGEEDLAEIVDPRLKKDIRLAYPLLDGLICQIDEVPTWLVTDYPIYSMKKSKPEIQKQIEFWGERLATPYVAVVKDNEIIAMTEDFQQLDYIELNIITYCASVYSDKALVEIPVYLYKLAPNNAYRLILIKLFENTSMVALCGSVTNITSIRFTPHDISQLEPLRHAQKGVKSLPPGLIGTLIQDEALLKTLLYIRPAKSTLMENELTEEEIKVCLMRVFRDTKTHNPTHSEFYSARKHYKFSDNPWSERKEKKKPLTADDFGIMAQKMLEQAQAKILAESAIREKEETNSKIDRLEEQLQQLINQNKKVPLPSAATSRKPRPPSSSIQSKCSKCANAMKEMRKMATSFEEQTNTLQEEILKIKNEEFALRRLTEDQQLDINQKTSQLQTALDGLVKFKDLATAEREKNDSHEQTLARTLKDFNNEKRAMKNLQEELNMLRHQNDKQAEENRSLSIANETLSSKFNTLESKFDESEKALKLANEKLAVSIHPDSTDMQKYVKDKLQVAVAYMEEYKTDAKKKYSALELEFREALKIEDNEKNKLREKIDKLKEEHAELRINQERLFFSEKKAKDTVELVASGAKELKTRNAELEDKIDRLVDAVRKAKELADQRYKDEQRTKLALQESQKTKTKLIATLTEQEGIVNGLKAEREQWSKGLASQTTDLAKEKGNLQAENEALKQKLSIEAQNEKKLKIKEKELESSQQQIQDLKAKLDQKRRQAFELQAECDSHAKQLEKSERRLARGEADREHLLDEKERFYAQKKINEEKWRERTIVIENLEEKLAHFSAQKQQKEDELHRDILGKEKAISDLQNEIAEKEKSHKELEAKLKTVIHFEEDNRKLARLVRAQAVKIKEVEDELRELLRDRQNDRISLQKKFQDFAQTLAK